MKKIRRRTNRLAAWLLSAAMVAGCGTGLTPTALAAEEDGYKAVQSWTFEGDTEGWAYNDGWTESGIKAGTPPAVTQENGRLKLTVDYSKAAEEGKGWAQAAISCGDLALAGASRVTMDVFFEPAQLTDGALTVKVALGDGDGSTKVADSSETFEAEDGLVRRTVVIDLGKKATGTDFVLCIVGQNTSYSGSIWLDNIRALQEDDISGKPEGLPILWSFDSGIEGWSDGGSWSYDGTTAISWDSERKMLRLDVDYSADKDKGWSETKVNFKDENGFDATGANLVSMDIVFDPALMTDGGLSIKISDNAGVIPADSTGTVQLDKAVEYDGGLKKAVCEINFSTIRKGAMNEMTVALVGNNTSYRGPVWIDNICFDQQKLPSEEDVYVDATETANTHTAISGSAAALSVNGREYPYAGEIRMADPNADPAAVALYQYLKAVGESGGALYGHMEDTVLKAGASDLSYSDTEDMTGSSAAINGLDCGGLFSGFGAKYNARHPEDKVPSGIAGDITAAARLSNEAIAEGAIMTLSVHMPNFAYAKETDPSAAKTYDRYDYTKADSYNLTGDCMNQILPGSAFNPQFTAFLDLVAEYAQQVDGAILFRPFHENTGSWFWWGKAFCDAQTYKSVFRYTVEYLRDEKHIHNLLYVYGPGSEAANLAEYGERYPGDAFVDMVGFDTYDNEASQSESYTFLKNFEATVKLTDQFAKEHGKLFAVTETGIANSAMKKTGNERPEWFTEILDIVTDPAYNCAYYMVWSNYDAKSNYYTPFVDSVKTDGTLHGHELMDGFIRFYNDERSIFAADLQGIPTPAQPSLSGWGNTGYFTAPNAGTRILEETVVRAQVSAGVTQAAIYVSNGTTELPLETTISGRTVSATLTAELLAQLGEAAAGKISLRSGTDTLAEITVIYNIPAKEPDPYMVDDFESYFGVDSMLTSAWATNKATGSNVMISLDSERAQDGCAMKFEYTETSGGWAGATITKTVDWSDCNALQFWTIPDGKQQKTVIQIDANSTCYEVYLNLYDAYNARAGKPTLVTIPFSEFCQRDTAGNPKGGLVQDCGSVGSFGLWINAEDNEFLVDGTVSGTVWYDNITAITSDYTGPVFETPTSPPVSQTYTITASAGTGGTISPNGAVHVEAGKSQSFTVVPNTGYDIEDLRVDGKSVGAVSSYTFNNVSEDHTIEAIFYVQSGGSSSSGGSKPSKPTTKPGDTSVKPGQQYNDVSSDSWYAEAVQYVSGRGLMTGTAAGVFSPSLPVNRAMMWMVLARLDGADTAGGTLWYEQVRTWAMNKGISDGNSPLENGTREQMVTMLWRYAGCPASAGTLNQFSDSAAVSYWAAEAIRWAVAKGILLGSDGKLDPRGIATRAEVAAMVQRYDKHTGA